MVQTMPHIPAKCRSVTTFAIFLTRFFDMTRTTTHTRRTIGVASAASKARRTAKHTAVGRRSVPNVLTRAAKKKAEELKDKPKGNPSNPRADSSKPGKYQDNFEDCQDFPPDEYDPDEYYSESEEDPEETAKEEAAYDAWVEQAVETHFESEFDVARGK